MKNNIYTSLLVVHIVVKILHLDIYIFLN